MVSSTVGTTEEQLIRRLKLIAAENAFDPEYKELRSSLPEEFPF